MSASPSTATPDSAGVDTSRPARPRRAWRTVAVPTEHGGWGLTAEPILLGLAISFSWAGLAIGVAALLAFLVRTPLKLALVDRRRNRSLDRTRLAWRIAATELALLLALSVVAIIAAGWSWLAPVATAVPFIAVELWFDIRSRGRRLVPELSGAIGIAAVAASIVLAGDGSTRLAVAAWLILAGRAIASIPFVRTQIERLRHGTATLQATDTFQAVGVVVVSLAASIEPVVAPGAVAVGLLAIIQSALMRRSHIPPAKVIGLTQMALGSVVVATTVAGVLILT